ncbi:MAG: hypothetical protein P8163_11420 [Candidatus Thiodiazotropha sp.]
MIDDGILDHRQFIKSLVSLCRERSSGTVFYNLSSGLSVRIVMNRGEINWVAFGEHRGIDAIEEISVIENGRMSFNPSLKLTIGKQNLPSTPEILKMINTRGIELKSRPKVSHQTTEKSNPTHTTSGTTFDKNQICEIVVKESIEYIGPIAKIVCADYMKSQPDEISLNSLRKLIDIIVLDINDDTKGHIFKDRIRSLLKIN